MAAFQFAPARRNKRQARIALAGPSGSGKSYTALTLATALVGAVTVGDGDRKICVVDAERETSTLYSANPEVPGVEKLPTGSAEAGGFGFSVIHPVRFNPAELVEIVDSAADAEAECLVIDTGSPYWNGSAGMLEQVDLLRRKSNNPTGLDAWKEAGRLFEKPMIEALLGFPGHVIFCMRSKQTYVIEGDDDGKKTVAKKGLAPQQRDGIEYEFDIVGDIDTEHYLRFTKTRCSTLDGLVVHKPGPELAGTILDWLRQGEAPKYVDWASALAQVTSEPQLWELWARAERSGVSRLLRNDFTGRKNELLSRLDTAVLAAAHADEADEEVLTQ